MTEQHNQETSPLRKSGYSTRPQDVDKYVGQRIRERRVNLGLTQQELADLIGVTYQQAHKYEKGINRVSAGRLFCIAQVFGVSVSFFYEGLETVGDTPANERQRMCLELARNFSLITNSRHQEALTQLARALASNSGTQTDAFIPEKTPEPIVFAEA
ncbi:MAG: helix-turn-helix domain-containing protein [Holosporales bacterium]|jgi:transcriptional regulator with XRE-family HTH domain